MNIALSSIVGLIFGLGLIMAGMTDPAKVLAFLDLAGQWDPSLALVMGGAIPVSAIAFWHAERKKAALLGQSIQLPDTLHLDWRLITGSALFGIGWGLAGICPGPALALLGYGAWQGLVFVAAMIAGMALHALLLGQEA